jgi:hypothetical protein
MPLLTVIFSHLISVDIIGVGAELISNISHWPSLLTLSESTKPCCTEGDESSEDGSRIVGLFPPFMG